MENRPVVIVTGAAGFIGSHLVDFLIQQGKSVIGVDNLLLGKTKFLEAATATGHFRFVEADVTNTEFLATGLRKLLEGREASEVWHLAANSDIAAGADSPERDLQHTFLSTLRTLGWTRQLGIKKFVFASTSAIYGDHGDKVLSENIGPIFPVSNYGAMKLASEAAISAALERYLDQVWIFRFPNVVGSRATHGALYDFFHKLAKSPTELEVLGNGRQQKEYLHVSDLIQAMWRGRTQSDERLNFFNVGCGDEGVPVSRMAELVIENVNPQAQIRYTGGTKGWPGDVPRFRYDTSKIRGLGWAPTHTSLEAVSRAVREIGLERGSG